MALGATILALPKPAGAATPTVTFSGTPILSTGLLSCPSTPSTRHLAVTAGATVNFINHLGRDATLHVGSATRQVADKASTPFALRTAVEGLTVYMVPSCALDTGAHTRMSIDVDPATSSTTKSVADSAKTPQPQSAGISQRTNVEATGGGATIYGAQVPAGTSTVEAGAPVVITNNRDLIVMIVLFAAVLATAAVCTALLLWRRLPRRPHVHGGGNGGGLYLVGKDGTVPKGQAAQIWEMAHRIGYRQGRGSRQSRS